MHAGIRKRHVGTLLSLALLGLVGCEETGFPEDRAPEAGSPSRTSARRPPRGNFAAETVKVGDTTRAYRLVVPETVDLARPAPLVVAFHGMLIDSKDLMPRYTRLNETAEKHRFLLAYPNAVGGSWGLDPDKVKNDLAFFDALLENLSTGYRIDPKRVYVVGMSNGGYFAHLVGKERSRTVAAVASHSGPLGLQTLFGIRAERKFPVLILHGDKDKLLIVTEFGVGSFCGPLCSRRG